MIAWEKNSVSNQAHVKGWPCFSRDTTPVVILLFLLSKWTGDSDTASGYLKNHSNQSPTSEELAIRIPSEITETEYYEPFNHFHQNLL